MLKNLLDKGKCLVGLHQGEWNFIRENDCTILRVCQRCGVENRKIEHGWPAWGYVKEQDCEQQRLCSRCQLTEQRVVHQWQDPVFKSSDGCDRVKICSRCSGEQEASPSHSWGQWDYIADDSCTQAQICERCGLAGGKKRTEHLWGEWQHSEQHGGGVRVCRRCGELTVSKQAQNLARSAAASSEKATGGAAAPPRSAADEERARMFEALKPKMNQLSEMMGAMGGILGKMEEQALEQSAGAGNTDQAPTLMEPADSISYENEVERDERLVGHWRFTDTMSSGGGFSQATDYHRVLGTDGVFFDRSHTCGSFGESWSDPEYGRWRTDRRTLYLEYNDGSERTYEYHLEDNNLFFPGARIQRLWERVG